MKKIPVGKQHYALVSAVDFARLSRYRWWVKKGRNTLYARTRIEGKQVGMHQLVKSVKKPFLIDHKNQNGLDNQRKNLRKFTVKQNSLNRKEKQSNKIHWYRQRKRWRVIVYGKYIGLFKEYEEATKARDKVMGV